MGRKKDLESQVDWMEQSGRPKRMYNNKGSGDGGGGSGETTTTTAKQREIIKILWWVDETKYGVQIWETKMKSACFCCCQTTLKRERARMNEWMESAFLLPKHPCFVCSSSQQSPLTKLNEVLLFRVLLHSKQQKKGEEQHFKNCY